MYYEGFKTGDRIEVTPTYRCQLDPFLNSNIRDLNNPGKYYKPQTPINGYVLNETMNGIWVQLENERKFYEKDKYIFKKLASKKNNNPT